MAETQGVADIAVPQVQSAPQQSVTDYNAVLNQAATQATQALPSPYTTGVQQATPAMPRAIQPAPAFQKPQAQNATPGAQKSARTAGGIGAIMSMVTAGVQAERQKKQDSHEKVITNVMQSKQNVANAEKVLSTPGIDDTTKQQAQKVLDANKKNIQDLFADSKNTKMLEKAFDISYVDPEQNKTPEIQANLAAQKKFKAAGPLNYNNPQELAVAKAAGAVDPAQLNELKNDAKAQAGSRQNELQGGSGASPKSQTPYADAALKKDMPTMENNPQYAAALAQRETAQKQVMTVLPKVIEANSKASLAAAAAGNKIELAKYEGTIKAQAAATEQINKAKNITANNKAAMSRVVQQGSNQVRAIMARAAAIAGVTGNPKIDQTVKDKLGITALKGLDAEIDAATKNRTNLDTQLMATTDEGERAALTAQLAFNHDVLTQLNNTRASSAKQYFPNDVAKQAPTGTQATGDNSTLWSTFKLGVGSRLTPARAAELGLGDKNAGTTIEPVGTNESDSDETNYPQSDTDNKPEDNPDNYLSN